MPTHKDLPPPEDGDIEAFRARQAKEKNEAHKRAAAVYIPQPEDPIRREELEQDPLLWLPHYLPEVFSDGFEEHHIDMVKAIDRAATYTGDQAIAAPRGEGKTTIAEGTTLFCMLRRLKPVPFAVIFAATGSDAEDSLNSVKEYICESDRLLADYPELCVPVREVQATPNKAHSMRVYGDHFPLAKARFQWSGREISFPNVPGFFAAKTRFATRGLDAAVRGLKKGTRRPTLAVIDDPDTESTAASEDQTDKLIRRIERAIAGLAPKGKRMSRVLLSTLQNRTCASAQFTDSQIKPSWNGKRFKLVITPPADTDSWDEYCGMRQQNMADGDPFARGAHAFYLEHREQMDEGAVVANPYSYDARILPDGSALQVSTLQRYYDFVADNGEHAALSELQNDPPEESGPVESGITAYRIQRQVSGYPRRVVPPDVLALVQGIDPGKYACHWVVKAFRADATGFVIDYGVQEVLGTKITSPDAAIDQAILRALRTRRETVLANPYCTADGKPVEILKTVTDAGYRTHIVYGFCQEAGLGFEAAMGFGKAAGCAGPMFSQPVRATDTKRPGGEGWFKSLRPRGTWLVCMHKDHWLGWEHDRWMTPPDMPGTCMLFGDPGEGDRLSPDQKGHFSFSKHLTALVQREEPTKDKGIIRRWHVKSDTDHYFSASYQADVAGCMCGVSLLKKVKKPGQSRRTLAELAGAT